MKTTNRRSGRKAEKPRRGRHHIDSGIAAERGIHMKNSRKNTCAKYTGKASFITMVMNSEEKLPSTVDQFADAEKGEKILLGTLSREEQAYEFALCYQRAYETGNFVAQFSHEAVFQNVEIAEKAQKLSENASLRAKLKLFRKVSENDFWTQVSVDASKTGASIGVPVPKARTHISDIAKRSGKLHHVEDIGEGKKKWVMYPDSRDHAYWDEKIDGAVMTHDHASTMYFLEKYIQEQLPESLHFTFVKSDIFGLPVEELNDTSDLAKLEDVQDFVTELTLKQFPLFRFSSRVEDIRAVVEPDGLTFGGKKEADDVVSSWDLFDIAYMYYEKYIEEGMEKADAAKAALKKLVAITRTGFYGEAMTHYSDDDILTAFSNLYFASLKKIFFSEVKNAEENFRVNTVKAKKIITLFFDLWCEKRAAHPEAFDRDAAVKAKREAREAEIREYFESIEKEKRAFAAEDSFDEEIVDM